MTVGGKPAFFMIGGSMELDKNDIISTVSNYLIEENLELYRKAYQLIKMLLS